MHAKTLLSLASLSLLVSCGWVDSTGRSSNSSPVTQISFDGDQQSETTQVNELASVRVQASGSDADGSIASYQWSNQPVRQGALSECALAGSDFDINIAANSLQDACASPDECTVSIEKQSDSTDDSVEFLITAPDLRAPIGVTYELIATDNDGGVGTQQSTFCLIAINSAPEADDDSFTVLEGTTLEVGSAPERNLLTNDSDDNHVLNKPLSVLLTPKRPPARASAFTLRADGGFSYIPLPSSLSTDTDDSFEYWITDGVHDPVSATATVRIVAKDDSPELIDDIPLVEAVAGVYFEFDVGAYFEDPEGSDLNFAIVGGSLPQSGALDLSALGVLSGKAELFDEGSYSISIAASDGSSGVTGALKLDVLENLSVQAVPIAAQAADAGEAFTLDVSDQFVDPEGEPLRFSVDTVYSDAQLTMNANTGVLRAVFDDGGRYTIDVSASDGVTQPTSIRFVVVVTLDNTAPIFRGTIASQSVVQGNLITPISGIFSDVDNDDLEYTAIGTLPTGLSLSSAGEISGRPTRVGRFAGIRIIATDPFGEFARSNAFTLTVIAAPVVRPANTSPVYVDDTVFNQGILLGAPITPLRPQFIDADGDVLSYRVLGGVLPVGVTINTATGIISGTPRARIWQRGLQVLATDPSGASAASDEFWIRIQ